MFWHIYHGKWFHGISLNLLILKLTDAISEPGQSHQRTDCSNKMDKWFLGSSFSANIYWSANIIHCSNDFVTNFVKLLFFCVVPAIRSTNLFRDIFRHWERLHGLVSVRFSWISVGHDLLALNKCKYSSTWAESTYVYPLQYIFLDFLTPSSSKDNHCVVPDSQGTNPCHLFRQTTFDINE